MNRKILHGFTLIETLLVMVIIGILAIVLSEAYITVSEVSLRVEQEKNVSEESLLLTQVLQSIADESSIDYDKYESKLLESNGYTDTLYLTGGKWEGTKIYTTGNCLSLTGAEFSEDDEGNHNTINMNEYSGCNLVLEQNGVITNLTSSKKIIISNVLFKVIPFDSEKGYSENEGMDIIINDVHKPAFRIFIHFYSTLYKPSGVNKIEQPLQLFFNLNG